MRRWLIGLLALLLGFALAQTATPTATPTPAAQAAADQGVQDWLAGKYRSSRADQLKAQQDLEKAISEAQTPQEAIQALRQAVRRIQEQGRFQSAPQDATTNVSLRRFVGVQGSAQVFRYPVSIRGQVFDAEVAVTRDAQGTWTPQGVSLSGSALLDRLNNPVAVIIFTVLSVGLVAALFVPNGFRTWLGRAMAIAREQRVLFIVLNVVLYGLFALGCVIGAALPDLSRTAAEVLGGSLTQTGIQNFQTNVPTFATGIASWNYTVGVLVSYAFGLLLGVPALLLNIVRLFVVGLAIAPGATVTPASFALHIPTILIELQAYIFVAASAIAWLVRWARIGFLRAWRDFAYSLAPALLLIVIGAWYEAFEIMVLVPLVR